MRYRGIFINDEAPALTGWVREKFGGYNVKFYKKVFELLLRLKANFLWPAMWPGWPNPGASFFTDDPENQRTADIWGIVISTSHHEPMQRMSNEWVAENQMGTWDWTTNKEKITEFFAKGVERAKNYESYFTMGMRGEYDTTMQTDDPAAVVKDVLKTQRQLIKNVHGREDAVPQLLALYKEVQKQYESGQLEVPDDVTLLFSDDNFGAIRRLPYGDEVHRRGGAGLYYHLEYVGTPRSYKWLNSNSLRKMVHQLHEAHRRQARQIWVFNVGDIKPLEVPLTVAMAMAWDVDAVQESDVGLPSFLGALACRFFGPILSIPVMKVWMEYEVMISLRRHEHIEPATFSLLHYNEADIISRRWCNINTLAQCIHDLAPRNFRPAIFQLVLYPVKATMLFVLLQIQLARNQLHGRQRRTSTNVYGNEVVQLLGNDYQLTRVYHELLGGKWNHIASQPHYGFDQSTWHAPSRDMISGLCFVQTRQDSNGIVGQMGVMVEGHEGVRPGLINENSDFTRPSRGDLVPGLTLDLMTRYGPTNRWFDLYSRGTSPVHWSIQTPYEWLKLSCTEGVLRRGQQADQRIAVCIDWEQVPADFEEEVLIDIESKEGDFEQVHLPVTGRRAPQGTQASIEADGIICLGMRGDLGSLRGVALMGLSTHPSAFEHPVEWYDERGLVFPELNASIFFFSDVSASPCARMLLYFDMTLDVDPSNPMSYDVSFDDGPRTRYRLLDEDTGDGNAELPSPKGWLKAVQDCVWVKQHDLRPFRLGPGNHIIHLRLLHTNIILKKVIFDLGGLKQGSYGGPEGCVPSFIRLTPLARLDECLERSNQHSGTFSRRLETDLVVRDLIPDSA